MYSPVENSCEDFSELHQYYLSIINAMPNIAYWIDKECNLKGCNNHFIKLLGLQSLKDFQGSPYEKMQQSLWRQECIAALRLDDMNVLFSGVATYNVEEKPISTAKGKTYYFQSNRVPLYNANKEIIGLVVIFTDLTLDKLRMGQASKLLQESPQTYEYMAAGNLPKVLMVEDNLIAQNVEKALLTSLHCQVDIAGSAEAALKLFQPGKYDLVFMDIGLEESSGYLVAKELRHKEKNTKHHVPIIALTGYEADVIKYDCQHYFMEGAISKPLTSEQAEEIIKHYVYHMNVPVKGLKTI